MRSALRKLSGVIKEKPTSVDYQLSKTSYESTERGRTVVVCSPPSPPDLLSISPNLGQVGPPPSSKSSQSQNISSIASWFQDFISAEINESIYIKPLYKMHYLEFGNKLNFNRKSRNICIWLMRSSYGIHVSWWIHLRSWEYLFYGHVFSS